MGRFKNYAALGDATFRRFTLIFAENVRGKTTFCAILRSLFTNTPAFIIGRKMLGSITNGNVAFRNGAWSAAFPHIAVFDGTYISENDLEEQMMKKPAWASMPVLDVRPLSPQQLRIITKGFDAATERRLAPLAQLDNDPAPRRRRG